MSICLADARAAASRRNGAQSRGPKTPEGKARSAQNALKHGLRAQKFVVVGDEKAAAFAALEAALTDELAPDGALQGLLAGRIARAAWRLERAERIEAELFVRHADRDRNLGLAMIRDGNGTRAFDTLLRYRGSALAELWRALRLLKALQAEAASPVREASPGTAPEKPIEPEGRANPGEIASLPAADEPEAPCRRADADAAPGEAECGGMGPGQCPRVLARPVANPPARGENPIEPEGRANPDEVASPPAADEARLDGFAGRREVDGARFQTARCGPAHRTTPPAPPRSGNPGAGARRGDPQAGWLLANAK